MLKLQRVTIFRDSLSNILKSISKLEILHQIKEIFDRKFYCETDFYLKVM